MKISYLYYSFVLLLASNFVGYSTTINKVDSLKRLIKLSIHDSIKVNAYIEWDKLIYTSDPDLDIKLTQKIQKICERNLKLSSLNKKEIVFYKSNLAFTYLSLGISEANSGNYLTAIELYQNALKANLEVENSSGIANSLNNLGNVYEKTGDFSRSLHYHYRALKQREKMKDYYGIALSLNNIGLVKINLKQFNDARNDIRRAIAFMQKHKDPALAVCFCNMGIVFEKELSYDSALFYYSLSLDEAVRNANEGQIATAYNNLGNCFMYKAEYKKAIDFYKKGGLIFEKYMEPFGMSAAYNNMGSGYYYLKEFKTSRTLQNKALQLSLKINFKEVVKNSYLALARIDSALQNYEDAFINYKNYILFSDSLINEENTKKTVQTQMQYEFDKIQTADSIKTAERTNQEKFKHNQEIKQQKIYTYGGIVGFGLMLIVALVSFRAFKNKQKANKLIAQQKLLVEEKQKEVMDSIRYAKRIQLALLPSEKMIGKIINKSN